MNKKLTTTAAATPLGNANGTKLMKVSSGPNAGRRVALVQTAAGEIQLTWSDNPRMNWSALTSVVTDCSDLPFSACINEAGDIWLAYSEVTTEYLVCRKLTFTGGLWSVGSKVTIYNGDVSKYPSIALEDGSRLWISWTRTNSSLDYIQIKFSDDSGATWEGGAADLGDTITSGTSSAFSEVLTGAHYVYLIYTDAGTSLSFHAKAISDSVWPSATVLASGTGFDQHFSANLSDAELLGVVFDDGQLKYRDFDSYNWSGTVILDSTEALFPQLTFNGVAPFVSYLSSVASDSVLSYSSRASGNWSSVVPLEKKSKTFDAVTIYSGIYASFEDATAKSKETTAADVYHASTNVLAKDLGDAIYLGMDHRFRFVDFDLSTAGVGGAVVYSYWNGENWIALTPVDGSFAFDLTSKELRLWDDYQSIPLDWQKRLVDSDSRFWIKIEVTSAFTTGAIGTKISAISNLEALSVGR